jgi:hypothetical protein
MRTLFVFIGNVVHWLAMGLVLFVLATPALASFYLDAFGGVTTGAVTDKREVLAGRQDTWHRQFVLTVDYQPADSRSHETAYVEVSQTTYDQMRVGDPAHVRYQSVRLLREIPFFTSARLADQNTWSGLALWWQGVSAALWPAPAGAVVPATAQVDSITLVTQAVSSRSRSDLLRPYQRVEFTYSVPGLDTPVKGADVIDAGSVAGLEVGGQAKIEYAQADPRLSRLAGASYAYRWLNPLWGLGSVALALILCGLPGLFLGGLARLLHVRRRGQSGSARLT